MVGTGGSKYFNLEVLAKGCKVTEPETTESLTAAPQTDGQSQYSSVYPAQNQVQPISDAPVLSPVEIEERASFEGAEQYSFWEEEQRFEIHATIKKNTRIDQAKFNHRNSAAKYRNKERIIASFLIDSITKVVSEGLEQDTVQFMLQCRYYDQAERQAQTLEIVVDEATLSGDHLLQTIRNAFGSRHTPFPPKDQHDLNALLSKYIIETYNKSPKELHQTSQPDLSKIQDLPEPERKSIVKLFHKIYDADNRGMELLLAAGFGAVCSDKLENLECSLAPAMTKVIVVYGCQSNEQRNTIAALCNTTTEHTTIRHLSEIKVTANRNELQTLFFAHRYQLLLFLDDTISDYAKKQNIAKIQRISEYVSNGIPRAEQTTIPCSAVVFTSRKLVDFSDFSENCIFIDASELPRQDYDANVIADIVSDFLTLLYENTDYYLSSQQVQQILNNTFDTDESQQKNLMLCEIYHYMAEKLFGIYGIGNSEEEFILNRCLKKKRKPIAAYLNENSMILSPDAIAKRVADKLNSMVQNGMLHVTLYDKKLTAINQALLYEHCGEPVLLLSNEYFEELCASPAVESKRLREILNERGYILVNYQDKNCFRMPIDERKLYTAIKVAALDEKSREKLPELHPVWIPDLNDGTDRIFLANDEHGNPIYWPVGKMENRSVLVQGDTRTGKTYFATTRLIMGLHKLGYRVLIIDSAMSSYSQYELSKCGYDAPFVAEHFYHGTAESADEIMQEFESSLNQVYIVSSEIENDEKIKLCDLLFKYQKNQFNANLENTTPLFIVFEEAGDSGLGDAQALKRIYNQGSKMRLSTITILQMFTGEGSGRFRKMVGQALLKISFKCSTDRIRYLKEVIPPEIREMAVTRLPMLGVGEALVCGEFEKPDGSLAADSYIIKRE